MSNGDTSKDKAYGLEDLPPGRSDWARVDAMSEEELAAAAASDPDARLLTPEQLAGMRRALPEIDVKALRVRFGMTQEQFAAILRVPLSALRSWEEGRRRPEGAARALLTLVAREPDAVRRALAG